MKALISILLVSTISLLSLRTQAQCTSYTVSGGGAICSGSTGLPIALSGSDVGVNYQLKRGTTNVGTVVAGSGSSLTWASNTTAGTYTVVATTCSLTMNGNAVITVNALPVVYTVSGGGNYCAGGTGLPVTLSNSQTGVNYQLRIGGVNTGSPVAGTGAALSWPNNTSEGSYTVQAINAITNCASNMTGTATVVVSPIPAAFTVAGGGTICAGSTGVSITLSGSETNVKYQLLLNGSTNVGTAKTGTGAALTWTANTIAGTYSIMASNSTNASCTATMTGNAVVSVNPAPALFTMTGGSGTYCAGSPVIPIYLSGSEIGVNYQLKKGATAIGSSVAGTGSTLSWTSYTASTGTFTIVATNSSTGCTSTMNGSAVITVNPLPTSYTVGGGTSYCAGGSGVSITLSNSQVGVNYQLKNGSVNSGASLAGIGGLLTWPNITAPGTYSVVATNATTGCTLNMAGSRVVTINPLPTTFNVTGGTACAGATITVGLSGSTSGVNYQLMLNGSNLGAVKAGTGSALSWGTQSSTGVYTITAINATTSCTQVMNGSATIYPQPALFSVSANGTICVGSVASVTLSGSEVGANYQLQLGGVDLGAIVAGTGNSLTWSGLTTAGTYTVKAINANLSSCVQMMTGTASIVVSPPPALFNVIGGGTMCSTTRTGSSVMLDGSSTGVNYQLQVNGTNTGSPMAGTGSLLTWSNQLSIGTYTVLATTTATGCVQTMSGSAAITPDPVCSALEDFAFRYKYDGRKRMIGKKVPGADWVYMVYDDRDRLVLTQDGNQRINNQWTFTKYDALNRPVSTGVYATGSLVDQLGMQANVNDYYNSLATNNGSWYESFSTNAGNVHYYDNRSFPLVTDPNQYLTVTYYDDNTTLQTLWGSNYNYINDNLSSGGYAQQTDFRNVKGHPVASKTKLLDDSNLWLQSIVFYDDHYRAIQTITDNAKGGTDRVSNLYDFVGKTIATKTTHMVSAPSQQTVTETFDYDHAGRLMRAWHSVNEATPIILLQNEYNEIGQLVDKKLHSTDNGTTFKQSNDYRYNIRGWLTSINDSQLAVNGTNDDINDLFGMNLLYNDVLSGINNAPQFNGNISAIKWSNNLALDVTKDVAYKYSYDVMNRINSASYMTNLGTWTASSNFAENGFSYDLNGNIRSLTRTDASGVTMDNLTYDYTTQGSTSNQLKSVTDSGDKLKGFTDGNTSGDDYSYDANGNMKADKNKNITAIIYNYLNLPEQVTKSTGEKIVYTYDAGGRKLKQQVYNVSGSVTKKTDYDGTFIYQGDTLQFINHEEGRVVMKDVSTPEYQYHLKDHLGNVRVTFTTSPMVDSNTATYETANAAVEQSKFLRYTTARMINAAIFDHTNGTNSGYSERLNGSTNEKYGLARSISVMPGDVINAEVYAKYVDPTSSNWTSALTNLMSQIAANTTGVVVDGSSYTTSTSSFPVFTGVPAKTTDTGGPKAYLNWLVFDRNFVFVTGGFKQMTTVAKEAGTDVPHEYLSSGAITITQPGYVYIYLSNESTSTVEVYFDDFKVAQSNSLPVVQQEDFYPFGLTFNSYQRENSVPNKRNLFQNQEHIDDLGLNWDSFKWRNHQPDIGRFFNVDLLADKYVYNSPYAFSENNVTRHIELEGLEKVDFMIANYEVTHKSPTHRAVNEDPQRVISNTSNQSLNFSADFKTGEMQVGSAKDFGSPLKMAWQKVSGQEVGKLDYSLTMTGGTDKNGESKYLISGNMGEYGKFSIGVTVTDKSITFDASVNGVSKDEGMVVKMAGSYSCLPAGKADWLADDVLVVKTPDGQNTGAGNTSTYQYSINTFTTDKDKNCDKTDVDKVQTINLNNNK